MSSRRANNNSLTWWYVLDTSWRRLEDIFRKRLEDVLKKSWRCLQDVFARYLEDVLKTYHQDEYIRLDQDALKTPSEDVWLRWIYLCWTRHLLKTKTSDVFKTSSRCLHQDKCFLGINLVKAKFNSYVFKYSQINNEEVKHLYQILNPKKTRQKHDINLNCQPISEQCSLFIPPKNRRKPKGFWCLQRL